MEYRGFDIIKRNPGLYWVAFGGSVIGSATSEDKAKEFIDLIIYEE